MHHHPGFLGWPAHGLTSSTELAFCEYLPEIAFRYITLLAMRVWSQLEPARLRVYLSETLNCSPKLQRTFPIFQARFEAL